MTLLRVESLRQSYPAAGGRRIDALRGVDFLLDRDETLAVVGESGCGKSTLGRLILGLERPLSGQVLLDGERFSHLSPGRQRPLRRKVQLVFQDPQGSLDPRFTAARIVAEPLSIHGLYPGPARAGRVQELLAMVGLDAALASRYPHQLSGGQRQRLAIARALACQPLLLVADEPTSALDAMLKLQIMDLLCHIKQKLGMSLLIFTHELHVVRHLSRRLLVMLHGRVVEEGPTLGVLSAPSHPFTRGLLASLPSLKVPRPPTPPTGEAPDPGSLPVGCPFHPRCPVFAERRAGRCTDEEPELRPLSDDRRVACHEAEP